MRTPFSLWRWLTVQRQVLFASLVLTLVASSTSFWFVPTPATVQAQSTGSATHVSAASYLADSIARNTIVAAFGTNLASGTQSAPADSDLNTPGIQLPTTLLGTTVAINRVNLPLFFVSPTQVNYLLPADTPTGTQTIVITNGSGATFTSTIEVKNAAPAIFTANANGTGVPASDILRVRANGQQVYEKVFTRDPNPPNRFLANPIDLGPEGERVFLILYLTGVRYAPDPNGDRNANESVRVIVNGLTLQPAYVGAQGRLLGLDQINVELPRTLLGSGIGLDITVVLNGATVSNTTRAELTPPPPVTALDWRPLGLPNRNVRAFATVGASLFSATDQGIWVSNDNGTNWTNSSTGLPPGASVLSLLANGSTLYAGLAGTGGVCISTDNGQTWRPINNGLAGANLTVNNLLFFGPTLYAATAGGVCVYNNGQWQAVNANLTNLDARTLVVANGQLCVGTRGGGVFILNSTANNWSAFNTGLPTGAQIQTFATAGTAVYAGLNGYGLCVSRNGGAWTPVTGGLPANATVNSIWIDGPRCYVGTATGIYVTNDSGVTWTLLANGLNTCSSGGTGTANNVNVVRAIANRILGGSGGCGVYGAPLTTSTTNRVPVAYAQTVTLEEDTPQVIALSGNDPDLDPLTYQIVTSPTRGTLATGGLPYVRYTPNANYNGNDSFTFRVTDNRNGTSNTATINLVINSVNDAPQLGVINPVTVAVNQSVSFTVSATDVDAGQVVTLSAAGLPAGATFNPTTGVFTWKPTTAGAFSMSFTATDNGMPVLTHTRTVTITVNAPQGNRAPVANAQNVTLPEDSTRQITLTGSDADNNPLTFTVLTQPTRGTLTGTAPNLTYTPQANFAGSDSFTFKVNDGTVDSITATVTIFVSQVNDLPVLIVPATVSVAAGQNVTFKLDVEDPDKAQGQRYNYTSSNLPAGATLTADTGNQTATFRWTPGTSGTTTVNFTVTDDGNLSDTKTTTITATGPSPVGNWVNIKSNLASTFNARFVAASANRIFVSNGAELYAANASGGNISGGWAPFNTGLTLSNENSIEWIDVVDNKLYVGVRLLGLYVSDLTTANFTKFGTTPTFASGSNTYAMSVHLLFRHNGLLYGGFSLGNFGGYGNMYVSADEGTSWAALTGSGLPSDSWVPTDYAIAGNSIFVAYENSGLYRSTNSGVSWTRVGTSLPGGAARIHAIAANGATLFCSIYQSGAFGVYRSTNNGTAWTLMTNAEPFLSTPINDLEVVNGIVFASLLNQSPVTNTPQFSLDNGVTWRALDAGAAPTDRVIFATTGSALIGVNGTANNPAMTVLPSPAGNTVPQLTVPGEQIAKVGTPLSFQVSATDADAGQTLTYQASALPTNATFIPSSRTFNWTPGIAGTYTIGFTVTDNGTPALSQAKTVTIEVSAPDSTPDGFWEQGNDGLLAAGQVRFWATVGDKLFAATTRGQVYRLTATGWVSTSKNLPVIDPRTYSYGTFGFASGNGNLYLLTVNGLYRSSDQGETWTKPTNASFDVPNNFTQYGSLAVNGDKVWVSLSYYNSTTQVQTYLLRSTDGGVNWMKTGGDLNRILYSMLPLARSLFGSVPNTAPVRSLNEGNTFTPMSIPQIGIARTFTAAGHVLFVGSDEGYGVHRSFDHGATWEAANTGLISTNSNPLVRSLTYQAPFLIAATSQGIYYSLNLGGNWQPLINGETPTSTQEAVIYDGDIWVTTGDTRFNQANTTYAGVYVSPLPTISGNNAPTLTVNDAYTGTTGTALNFTVAANANDTGQTVTLRAANLPAGATFNTTTGAFAWTPLAPGTHTMSFSATDSGTPAISTTKVVTITTTGVNVVGNWVNSSNGLPSGTNTVQAVTALGTDVFVGTSSGIYRSSNNGASWTLSSDGLSSAERNITYMTNINGILYAAGYTGLYASNDGGASWTRLPASGTTPTSVIGLVGIGPSTLVAAGQFQQVWVSTNAGETWTVSTSGLPASFTPGALVARGNTILLGLNNYNTPSVYRSTNGGAAWTAANTGLGADLRTNAMTVKGTNVFLSPNGLSQVAGAVYKTANDGGQWTGSATGLPSSAVGNAMTASSSFVFLGISNAGSGNPAVWFSTDDGANWRSMSVGESFALPRALQVVGTRIFAATEAGLFVSPLPGTN